MQTVGHIARTARRLLKVETVLGSAWLIVLSVLEVAGRRFTSDVSDGFAFVGVCLFLLATVAVHHKQPMWTGSAIHAAIRSGWNTLARWKVEFGVDFVGDPPFCKGFPRIWGWPVAFVTILTPVVMIFAPHFPSEARAVMVPRFYLAYLTVFGLFWSALVLGILVHAFLGWSGLHDWLVVRYRGQKPRPIRNEVRAALIILTLALGGAALSPNWVPLAIHMLFLGTASLACLASSTGLQLIWRYRWGSTIQSFDGRWLLWMQCAGSILATALLVLLSTGENLWESPLFQQNGTTPVTSLLGRCFAWVSCVGNFVLVYYAARFAALGIYFNPYRLHRRMAYSEDGQITKPHKFRRAEIQCRRQIIRRLKSLIRHAMRQSGHTGAGIWIGLQHWFILGLTHDSETDEFVEREATVIDEIVGPPFHHVFSREARYHYWCVTKALQIDLIFVENGIRFRRLVRVLRMMFEIYDIHGGRQRAEEWHFTGLPDVRVVIHEFDMGTATMHVRERYPEPDYDQVGRGRILHVFKDRGETSEEVPVPASWEGMPVTSGV